MDMLHLFSKSPLKLIFDKQWPSPPVGRSGRFITHRGGLQYVGDAHASFAFDNERPPHKTWLDGYEISDRLVTNGEWLDFMADGGYERAELWLADGWTTVVKDGWKAPAYWSRTSCDSGWEQMTLSGPRPIIRNAAVTHVSFYEATAFATWAGARLPSEAEWECATRDGRLQQVDDVAWQWTRSAYQAYPGFRVSSGAVGEYNGKFMANQMVLRGGSLATPAGHSRPTYRNFFRPEQRWMFSGVRLARDLRPSGLIANPNGLFLNDVLAGLSKDSKMLSPKYFYDEKGSALFEEICETPEYYPTRTEATMIAEIAAQIAFDIPRRAVLVEFGSGASNKTRLILDAAPQIATYVPIDISEQALHQAARRIERDYAAISVLPLQGDFMQVIALPEETVDRVKVGFFPGSTIGNFTPQEAVHFLSSARRLLGDDSALIVGADLVKDEATMIAAYNDAQGVTANFNKNILVRINRELEADFNLDEFEHLALWNQQYNRIEMHLVSRIDQTVSVAAREFKFRAGERLHTENSHKFTIDSFSRMACAAGWTIKRSWIGSKPEFGIFSMSAAG